MSDFFIAAACVGPLTPLGIAGSLSPILPRPLPSPPPLPLGRRCPVAEMVVVRVELVARAVTSCALTAASSVVRLCNVAVSVSTVIQSAAAAVAKMSIVLATSSLCATLFTCSNAP